MSATKARAKLATCRFCGGEMDSLGDCPYCDLPDPPIPDADDVEVFCPRCGRELEPDDTDCGCGDHR